MGSPLLRTKTASILPDDLPSDKRLVKRSAGSPPCVAGCPEHAAKLVKRPMGNPTSLLPQDAPQVDKLLVKRRIVGPTCAMGCPQHDSKLEKRPAGNPTMLMSNDAQRHKKLAKRPTGGPLLNKPPRIVKRPFRSPALSPASGRPRALDKRTGDFIAIIGRFACSVSNLLLDALTGFSSPVVDVPVNECAPLGFNPTAADSSILSKLQRPVP